MNYNTTTHLSALHPSLLNQKMWETARKLVSEQTKPQRTNCKGTLDGEKHTVLSVSGGMS